MKRLKRADVKPYGGKRNGAGRPNGSKNKFTLGLAQYLFEDQGLMTPLEYLVRVYNNEAVNPKRRDHCAEKAGKWCHPTFSAITNTKGEDILPDLTQLPDQAIRALADVRSLLLTSDTKASSGTGTGKT